MVSAGPPGAAPARVGVLALQGDFAAHAAALQRLGVATREVRRVAQLAGLEGLVVPGGESTTLLNLMRDEPWFEALRAFDAAGGALLCTCAGTILAAREVRPAQPSLGLLDALAERNAYGRQIDSFEARLAAGPAGADLQAVFIRAPRLRSLGPQVEVLAHLDGEPVLVRQGRVLAATFHPEIAGDDRLHALFVEGLRASGTPAASAQRDAGELRLRTVRPADLETVVRHRRAMFADMGCRDAALLDVLDADARAFFGRALAAGRYHGLFLEAAEGGAVAGAGVLLLEYHSGPRQPGPLRPMLVNVYTEPGRRRQGLARRLVSELIAWTGAQGFRSLYLHASDDGRALYTELGFQPTNEMRLELRPAR